MYIDLVSLALSTEKVGGFYLGSFLIWEGGCKLMLAFV